ncbi:hypothetical protein Tco_1220973 [Tanacetum coccineum]
MQKAKKNMRKINFKRAVTQKFKEYDQKLEALTPINVSEEIDKAVHAKVLTKIKKLISTHVLKFLANYVKPRWFTKKSGSTNSKRRTTWFDLLLKSNIDQNEDHILGPSTMAIPKKLMEIIQKDELAIAYLEGDVSKPRSFERHMSKSSKTYPRFYNNDFYYLAYLSTEEKYTTSLTKHYVARYYIQGKVYPDKKIISFVRVVVKRKWGYEFLSSIVVRRSDKQEYTFSYADLPRLNLNDIEDMYLLKVKDKMHHLLSDDEKDFNKALLLFIQRTIIKNRVEDLQLGVDSYQRNLNLTKPRHYFDGIDENIPYTMTGIEKGVVYLNKYNRRSLIKLNEVHKFCDGTLMKIQENLIEMIIKNKMGRGNERLRGRDWNDKDVKRSQEMMDKIDQVMKRREQLRRLEEYVGGRPKTIDPRFLIRPM